MRSSKTGTWLTVRRRCLVCELETTVDEQEDTLPIGPLCADCHGPTERVEVLARRRASVERNPYAAELGRRGGLRGGPARAAALSAQRRREIARAAARKRWSRRRNES
jgi:hypothetical protein